MTPYEGDAVGLINERVRGCDDYDLLVRLASRFPFGYLDECLVQLRYHDTNMSWSEWPCLDFLIIADEFATRFPQHLVLVQKFHAIAHYNYGRYLQGRSERIRARIEFQKAIQADPRLWHAYVTWLRTFWPHPGP